MEKWLTRIRNSRRHKTLYRVLTCAACVVFFVTVYSLIYPAITMEKQGQAICGQEVHEHTAECYSDVLVCTLEKSVGHRHSDACYEVNRELTCGLDEHEHGEDCYDEDGNLICELAEHAHDDACYTEERVLICGLEESEGHLHSDACYEKELTCGLEVHTHTASCYAEVDGGEDEGQTLSAETFSDSESEQDTKAAAENTDEADRNDVMPAESEEADQNDAVPAESEEAVVESDVPVEVGKFLTKGTGLWLLNAENRWTAMGEETKITPESIILLRVAFDIPEGALTMGNKQSEYILPEGLNLTKTTVDFNNKDENGWNQVICGTRMPEEEAEEEEYLLGRYALLKGEKELLGEKYCRLVLDWDH